MILFIAVFSEEHRFSVRGVFGRQSRAEVVLMFQVQVGDPVLVGKGELDRAGMAG